MSGEATTELTQVGDVNLNQLLHVDAPSDDEADESAEERSDSPETPESDQRADAKDDVEALRAEYENRLRGLQAAKDKENAAIRAELQKHAQANQQYEQAMLQLAMQEAAANAQRQGFDPQAAARAIHENYQLTRQQVQMQTQQQYLQQQYAAQQADAAQVLAMKLATDPKYAGVDANELYQKWAPYGAQAMIQAAETMALGKRSENIARRKATKADKMGGGSGGSGDVTTTMSGADLIEHALKNSKRKARWE